MTRQEERRRSGLSEQPKRTVSVWLSEDQEITPARFCQHAGVLHGWLASTADAIDGGHGARRKFNSMGHSRRSLPSTTEKEDGRIKNAGIRYGECQFEVAVPELDSPFDDGPDECSQEYGAFYVGDELFAARLVLESWKSGSTGVCVGRIPVNRYFASMPRAGRKLSACD